MCHLKKKKKNKEKKKGFNVFVIPSPPTKDKDKTLFAQVHELFFLLTNTVNPSFYR